MEKKQSYWKSVFSDAEFLAILTPVLMWSFALSYLLFDQQFPLDVKFQGEYAYQLLSMASGTVSLLALSKYLKGKRLLILGLSLASQVAVTMLATRLVEGINQAILIEFFAYGIASFFILWMIFSILGLRYWFLYKMYRRIGLEVWACSQVNFIRSKWFFQVDFHWTKCFKRRKIAQRLNWIRSSRSTQGDLSEFPQSRFLVIGEFWIN